MTHGSIYAYRRHGCRCDLCRTANTRLVLCYRLLHPERWMQTHREQRRKARKRKARLRRKRLAYARYNVKRAASRSTKRDSQYVSIERDLERAGSRPYRERPGPASIYTGIDAPNFIFALQDTLRFVKHY